MAKEQIRMMSARDKLVGEARNPLTKLFRLLLSELQVSPESWNNRLTLFLNSRLSRVRKTAKDIGQERNNFNRAIAKNEITWKTFQKAVMIMGPAKYCMDIRLILRDGREVKVSTGFLENEFAKLDSTTAVITGKGMVPDHDINDYEEEDDGILLTVEEVDDAIDRLHRADQYELPFGDD